MNKNVDLCIECQKRWNTIVDVVPVIIGVMEVVGKNLKKHFKRKPGQDNFYNLEIIHPWNYTHPKESTIH